MYKVIVVDLDGTLLSSENKITKYTKKIINILIKDNFYFVLASGRHDIDVMKVKNILNIKAFMITSNGAKIYNLDNELIFSDNLNETIAAILCQIVYTDQDIITQIYQDNKWYINNNKADNGFLPDLSLLKYQYFHPDYFNYQNITKIFFTSKNYEKLCMLKKKIIQLLNNKIYISFSNKLCLEVISGQSSKGHGLKLISNLLKISLDEFIAFGDGMNDKDMLTIVGKAYIMKNADVLLKYTCPHIEIIDSNDDDGVAKCLYNMFIK
ncbi:Cof-type HAD-IIB family hydrolase [Buchnera aphidicola (Macrosiphoniella sanborni)]|uniref:Cof-type HAD-IIB family hydrolase n=1 Tax=Buchnera aphidicola (Macrosiphoniella sanborni) TaxID=1241865 RepID=A0A4D6Y282_9GAMM|nr:Cof-type HAD-IIB family hydrolase [Buchnera aphidicola]QCI23606.1 Cof-type HAD-IIB family hydrolase [Buchnera aphidicola (Macrosiphoniella sanborni)]